MFARKRSRFMVDTVTRKTIRLKNIGVIRSFARLVKERPRFSGSSSRARFCGNKRSNRDSMSKVLVAVPLIGLLFVVSSARQKLVPRFEDYRPHLHREACASEFAEREPCKDISDRIARGSERRT